MQDAKCCSPDMCGSAPLTFPAHCHSTSVLWQCAGKVRGADPHMSGEQHFASCMYVLTCICVCIK